MVDALEVVFLYFSHGCFSHWFLLATCFGRVPKGNGGVKGGANRTFMDFAVIADHVTGPNPGNGRFFSNMKTAACVAVISHCMESFSTWRWHLLGSACKLLNVFYVLHVSLFWDAHRYICCLSLSLLFHAFNLSICIYIYVSVYIYIYVCIYV